MAAPVRPAGVHLSSKVFENTNTFLLSPRAVELRDLCNIGRQTRGLSLKAMRLKNLTGLNYSTELIAGCPRLLFYLREGDQLLPVGIHIPVILHKG